MDNLMCNGQEGDIALCKFNGWGKAGQCTHSSDVGITCGNWSHIYKTVGWPL